MNKHTLFKTALALFLSSLTGFATLPILAQVSKPLPSKVKVAQAGVKEFNSLEALRPDGILTPDRYLLSNNGMYKFVMQGDGNLVLYKLSLGREVALWASNTDRQAVSKLVMQGDGNLVIYGVNGNPLWASNTDGNPGAYVKVQNDGNVVIYKPGPGGREQPIWATNTNSSTPGGERLLEELTDRCSGDVIIVPTFDAPPNTVGSIYLKRGSNGYTPWSNPMAVNGSRIRWYCHSTSPFGFLDPGTWRITGGNVTVKCDDTGNNCTTGGSVELGTSAINDFYPERSRCPDGSSYIKAFLGPSRLLRINCYQ